MSCEGSGLSGSPFVRSPPWDSFWSDTTLMAARYRTEPRFTVESVNSLFSLPDYFTSIDPYYSVTPDAERFLIQVHNPEAAIREIQVVLNWFEVVRERVGN